jgi:hypothetical protein
MPKKNGDGIIFHCSDCNKNEVRMYSSGGDGNASRCDMWMGLTDKAIRYIHDHREINHRIEDVCGDIDWKKVRENCGCDVCKQYLND